MACPKRPEAGRHADEARTPGSCLSPGGLEESFRRLAVRRGLALMSANSGNFGFERFDARCQFVMRIRVKRLGRQLAGEITFGTGEVVVHCSATLDGLRFVSTACMKCPGVASQV